MTRDLLDLKMLDAHRALERRSRDHFREIVDTADRALDDHFMRDPTVMADALERIRTLGRRGLELR